MNRFFKILLIIALPILSITFSSCSASKGLQKNNIKDISANRLIREIEQNNFVFDQLQAKFNAKVETPDANLSLKGQLRIKNDSIVWISVSLPIGVEVVRAMMTKDSVFIINRTDKTYIKESIQHFKQIPAHIAEIGFIQALLVGNDISLKKSEKYYVQIVDEKYNLLTSNVLKLQLKNNIETFSVTETHIINPDNFKICKLILQENSQKARKVELKYGKLETIEDGLIPTEIELEMNQNPSFYVKISYSNINLNAENDYKFSIPKKFTLAK